MLAHENRSKKLKQVEIGSVEIMLEQQLVGVETNEFPNDLAVSSNFSVAADIELKELDDIVTGKALAGNSDIGYQEHVERIDLENKDLELFDKLSLGYQQQTNTHQNLMLESHIISCNSDFQQHADCMSHHNQHNDEDILSSHLHQSENTLENQKNTALMNVDVDVFLEDWNLQIRKGRQIEHTTCKVSNHIELSMTKRFTRSSLKEVGGNQLLLQWHGTEAKMDEVINLIDRVLDDKVRLEELRRQREYAAVLKKDEKKKREEKKVAAVTKVQDKLAGKQKHGRNRGKGK